MDEPTVYSVILNTNRREDTLPCLASTHQNSYRNLKIIVLDNGSTDGSVDALRFAFPDVHIIGLKENLGYAGNNNIGIQRAAEQGIDWVFVLNEDIILDYQCIQNLMEFAEQDPQIGVLGPLVYHYNEPQVIQSAGGLLGRYWQSIHVGKNELDRGQYVEPRQVEWISGCAILVRRGAIEQAGMLDEHYFMYWEETEWCIRISRAGWKIMNVPDAKIWHKGVQRDYEPKPAFTYYGTRNHLLMLAKHHAPLRAKIFTWVQLLRTLASWSIRPKWKHMCEHRDAMWKGVVDFLRHRWGQMSEHSYNLSQR